MFRFTIGVKIGAGLLLVSLLLVVCGLVGYWVEHRLTNAVAFISDTVWNTADVVNQGIGGVQRQIIAVDRILQGHTAWNDELASAQRQTQNANERLRQSGLLEAEDVQGVSSALDAFDQSRETLLAVHREYRAAQTGFDENVAQFQDFLIEVEKHASQHILNLQLNQGEQVLEDQTDVDDDSETLARYAINGATEARLALLTTANLR